MKILVLADFFATGGGAGAIAETMTAVLARLHEVKVLTAHAPQNLSPVNYQLVTSNLDYPRALRNYLGVYHPKAIRTLKRHLEAYRPDVVFVHVLHTNWSYYALKTMREMNIRSVVVFHDVSAFTPYTKLCKIKNQDYRYSFRRHLRGAKLSFNPFRNFLIRRYVRYATKMVAVSNELKKALEANGIRVDTVIHNGIALDNNAPQPPLKIRGGEGELFFGGRLSTSKGTMQAVQYLQILKNEYKIFPKLVVAGAEGQAADDMRKEAKRLEVLEQIKFLGWLEKPDYERALQASSVVIVPSICFDSFPTVILEAMKFRKPVVATDQGGAKELVVNGVTGYIRDPKDAKEFSARIAEILTDAKKAAAMGEMGYERVKENFTAEKMVKEYLGLI